ncbi:MAG: amidohydrolase family protein [Synechococcaceae cyanobacterium SM2_3_2]|nr:amidohydrolase family protein [Synechococcaceae cyanobacterium SM2_3_2]
MTLDLIIRGATLANYNPGSPASGWDIGIQGDRIVAIEPHLEATARTELEAEGYLVSPPFVDAHFHLDSTLALTTHPDQKGSPRVNRSGTLLEGISLWGQIKPDLTAADLHARAIDYCQWALARGIQAIRAHVDICDPRLLAVEALLEVKRQMRPYLELQLVAFPQDGYLRFAQSRQLLDKALAMGVEVVGGIPHFERTQAEGVASIRALCELAAELGLRVDMHCDETDDPHSRYVETLASETQRLGLQGRVTGSHLTSMHSMDNAYVSKLIPLMAEAALGVVANPLINITLQGRLDSYPKRRGMTRVPELMAAGLTVAFGHDCVMDPWYGLGSGHMVDVAHMGLHIAQMTGIAQMEQCYGAVTDHPARLLGLEDYGIQVGCFADLVILQARSIPEVLRLRPVCLTVLRRGQVIAHTPPVITQLHLGQQSIPVDFLRS